MNQANPHFDDESLAGANAPIEPLGPFVLQGFAVIERASRRRELEAILSKAAGLHRASEQEPGNKVSDA